MPSVQRKGGKVRIDSRYQMETDNLIGDHQLFSCRPSYANNANAIHRACPRKQNVAIHDFMFGTRLKMFRKCLVLPLLILERLDSGGLENAPSAVLLWLRNTCWAPTRIHTCGNTAEARPNPVSRQLWHIIRRLFGDTGLFQDIRTDSFRLNATQ